MDPDQQSPINNQEAEEADAAPAPVISTGKHHENLARAATTAGIVTRPARTAPMDPKGKEREREILQVGESKVSSRNRPASYAYHPGTTSRAPGSGDGTVSKAPSRRPSRDKNGPPVSGKVLATVEAGSTSTRPNTANSGGGSNRMPSRGGYSRPVAPSVAANSSNAQGKIAMPKSGKPYTISNPIPQPDNSEAIGSSEMGKPMTTTLPANRPSTQPEQTPKGHKRANTVGGGTGSESGGFLGKFMGGSDKQEGPLRPIMTAAGDHRQSLDQGGRSKFGGASASKSRRFSSLLPTSFTLRSISGSGHTRRPSRSTSGLSGGRQFVTPESQPQTLSQPQLGVPRTGGSESVLSGSDTSLAVESAPASAAGGAYGRDSIDVPSRRPTVLQKNNRKFTEGEVSGTGGSSGPARRVMDFFRRRGVVRSKGEV